MDNKLVLLGMAALGGVILLSKKTVAATQSAAPSGGYSYIIEKVDDVYYAISGDGTSVYSSSDAYTVFNSAVAAGGTSFFVKKDTTIQFPASNNNVPGVTIQGEDWNTVVLSVENPTINYLGGLPGCTLINVGIQSAFHDDPAFHAGSTKRIKYWTNVRRVNTAAIANWDSQGILVIGGEPGVDSPLLSIENQGMGDSAYFSMNDTISGPSGGAATIRIADYSKYYNNQAIANVKIDDLNASAQASGERNYLWITGTPGDYIKVSSRGIKSSTLGGTGNGYVCVDNTGKLYRSQTPCV